MRAIAIYKCISESTEELSFNVGDLILKVKPDQEQGWFFGELASTGTRGLFPGNYCRFEDSVSDGGRPISLLNPSLSRPFQSETPLNPLIPTQNNKVRPKIPTRPSSSVQSPTAGLKPGLTTTRAPPIPSATTKPNRSSHGSGSSLSSLHKPDTLLESSNLTDSPFGSQSDMSTENLGLGAVKTRPPIPYRPFSIIAPGIHTSQSIQGIPNSQSIQGIHKSQSIQGIGKKKPPPVPVATSGFPDRYRNLFRTHDKFKQATLSPLIVKSIWSKSQLDAYTLGQIWECLIPASNGGLDELEFSMGVALIDGVLGGQAVPPITAVAALRARHKALRNPKKVPI